MGRAPCCDKANVKRGPWSPEEDATLKNYVQIHGTVANWISLPQKAGLKRCGKSCRLRWLNYLRPDIKHGGFTQEEDNIICTLYSQMGSRWSLIASQLPGRTDNDVKNHWNTKLKKKLLQLQANSSSSFNITATNNGSIPTAADQTISQPNYLLPKAEPYYNLDYSTNSHPISSHVVGYEISVSRTDHDQNLRNLDQVINFSNSAAVEAVTHNHLSQSSHNINVATASQDEPSSISISDSTTLLDDHDQFMRFSYMFPYNNEFVDGLWTQDKATADDSDTTETIRL